VYNPGYVDAKTFASKHQPPKLKNIKLQNKSQMKLITHFSSQKWGIDGNSFSYCCGLLGCTTHMVAFSFFDLSAFDIHLPLLGDCEVSEVAGWVKIHNPVLS